jgi:hypothetical protein
VSTFNPDAWQAADPDATTVTTTQPPSDGTYAVELADARAFTAQSGEDWVILKFRTLDQDPVGYTWDNVQGFASEGRTRATKAVCKRIGVDVDTIASLEDLDRQLRATKGEYRNTFVQERVTSSPPTSDVPSSGFDWPEGTQGVPEDEIPF